MTKKYTSETRTKNNNKTMKIKNKEKKADSFLLSNRICAMA